MYTIDDVDKYRARFLEKVEKIKNPDGCWLWTEGIFHNCGYGSFTINSNRVVAHRISWIIFKGKIPKNICVCHKCDVRNCVNPDHLFLGTRHENCLDMKRKNRGCKPRKILPEQEKYVPILKEKGFTIVEISEIFKCSPATVVVYLHKLKEKK